MTQPAPPVSLIWAMGENRVIGRDNALPWHLPADLKHFRTLTTGHHIIMGRKTYESFPRPLPDRTHVVVTSDPHYRAAPGCIVVHNVDAALDAARNNSEIFVIGGASLYAQMLSRADRLYITLIHAAFAGDARFPEFDWDDWTEVSREQHAPDERNPYAYTFLALKRKRRAD